MSSPASADDRFRTARFTVPEMDCPSCAGTVRRSVESLDGIVEIDAQVTIGRLDVRYDPSATDADEIAARVEGAGYEITDRRSDGAVDVAPPAEVWTSSRAIATWIGAVFLVAGLLVIFVLPGFDRQVVAVGSVDLAVSDLLLLSATLASGLPVVRSGYYSARTLSLDIDLLMGTAIVVATGLGLYIEAATLAVLFSIAELLETYAMDRARSSLRELLELSPEEARVLRDGEERTVPVDDLAIGEVVVVRPGEKIPADGVVREGVSAVDQSPITGESVPVDKTPGDEVYAGTLTEEGYLEVEVTAEAEESTLARIIEMVQGAEAERTEYEQFVDRFAGYYTPVVVVLAILTAVVPVLLFDAPWRTWVVRGLTLLVIACPCAFVISTPVSVVSGITSAARNGVLIKGGTYLEAMGAVDAIAIDKTGTLTKGNLAVTDLVPLSGGDEETLLRTAAALESRSEHPIAAAIIDHADERGIDTVDVDDFETLPGEGVRAEIDGTTHYAGKPDLFEGLSVDLSHTHLATDGGQRLRSGFDAADRTSPGSEGVVPASPAPCEEHDRPAVDLTEGVIPRLESEGKTVVLVGTERRLLGLVAVADELRPEAERAVARLHDLGVSRTIMLTGDNEGTARAIADRVGVSEYRAELLPDEKVDAVEALREEYGTVAMVGDGINDAPALAAADVGIAMGAAGTDTALETADVALMGDDLATLPYLYALSNRAEAVIRQNVYSSLGVKALLAVGVPFGYVTVAIAVLVGDMGMSLGVTGNAMRLSRLHPERFLGGE